MTQNKNWKRFQSFLSHSELSTSVHWYCFVPNRGVGVAGVSHQRSSTAFFISSNTFTFSVFSESAAVVTGPN